MHSNSRMLQSKLNIGQKAAEAKSQEHGGIQCLCGALWFNIVRPSGD
jgi:hypothetical protein